MSKASVLVMTLERFFGFEGDVVENLFIHYRRIVTLGMMNVKF